jgi:hypothetical protein
MSSGHKLWFTLPSGNPYSCLYLAFICNVPSWSRNYIDIEVGSLTGSGIRLAHSKASSDPEPQGQQATGAADILPVEFSRELFEADVGHSPQLKNPRGRHIPNPKLLPNGPAFWSQTELALRAKLSVSTFISAKLKRPVKRIRARVRQLKVKEK